MPPRALANLVDGFVFGCGCARGERPMNKTDLIEKIAKGARINKTQASSAMNAILDGIQSALKKGGRVALAGFGTFSVGSRKTRVGRNPRTGQSISTRRVARFRSDLGFNKQASDSEDAFLSSLRELSQFY
jgi:nucleoid DNA-binding protein